MVYQRMGPIVDIGKCDHLPVLNGIVHFVKILKKVFHQQILYLYYYIILYYIILYYHYELQNL